MRTILPGGRAPEERGAVKTPTERAGIYGLLAEFHTPEELVDAAAAASTRPATARWTPTRPIPIEELLRGAATSTTRTLPLIVLAGGIAGPARRAAGSSTGRR